MAVMRGQLSPEYLPSQRTAKARADAELEEWRKSGKRQEVFRDVPGEGRIAVPQHVLDAEARDPEHRERIFVRTIDRQGFPYTNWELPAPPVPERVLEAEAYFKVPYKWDPITQQYIKQVVHQKPPWMQRVDDMLDPNDGRRSRYRYDQERWVFPGEEPNLGQSSREREDLASENGFPMTGGDHRSVGRGPSHIMGTTEEGETS